MRSASARPTWARTATARTTTRNIRIANNQIIASGGTNLAGGIGIFNGADNYEIARNEICGNFSAEYGGGISHFGRSSGGRIHHNRIYFNASYDEGAGIMIAGQLPSPKNFPNLPVAAGRTHGSGAVTIDANVIQSNLSNDDGGGVRLLMAGVDPIRITNNQIVNNISTHEGGGIAIDDATDVTVAGNTVMKNITTATAMTSDGTPAPAGLSTAENSLWLTAPPANDTCLAPLNGSIASLTSTGTGNNNLRRRLNINQPWSALAPYVGKSGLTVTARNPSNGSQTQTRNVQSVSADAGPDRRHAVVLDQPGHHQRVALHPERAGLAVDLPELHPGAAGLHPADGVRQRLLGQPRRHATTAASSAASACPATRRRSTTGISAPTASRPPTP